MSSFRNLIAAITTVAVIAVGVTHFSGPVGAAAGDLSGTVFADEDEDGAIGSAESGVPDVIVTAYGPGGPAGSTTSGTTDPG